MRGERREESREESSAPAIVYDADGRFIMRCIVCDLSASGARLKLSEGAPLPRYFLLSLAPDGSTPRLCSKVWQLALIAGVRFVQKQAA